jgi:hypothetical protein
VVKKKRICFQENFCLGDNLGLKLMVFFGKSSTITVHNKLNPGNWKQKYGIHIRDKLFSK